MLFLQICDKMDSKSKNNFTLRAVGNKFILINDAPKDAEKPITLCNVKSNTEYPNQFSVQEPCYIMFDNFFRKLQR